MADVKILMVGGRRAGKSSILASMVKQLTDNAEITKYMRINRRITDRPNPVSLNDKQYKLESFLNNPKGNYYLVDIGADETFSYYPFRIGIPSGSGGACLGNIDIEFIDCPGETYTDTSAMNLHDELQREVPNTDIFIITVDTPYLMDPLSDSGKFKKVNEYVGIKDMFDGLVRFNTEDDYKKIIFVPVKCEAWRNRLNEVVEKLQGDNYYGPLFDRINLDKRWSCCILPALTAGGIQFAEFGEPKLLDNIACSPLGTKRVRMEDGNIRELLPNEKPVVNDKCLLPYYSWFENIGTYNPENCDQIALHVLRFIVYKMLVKRNNNWWKQHSPNNFFGLGYPSNAVMKKMIIDLEKNNFLKDGNPNSQGVDRGIVHIRKIETDNEINRFPDTIFGI